jgi:hypothetical protein
MVSMTWCSLHPGVAALRRGSRATSPISSDFRRQILAGLREFFLWVIIFEPG